MSLINNAAFYLDCLGIDRWQKRRIFNDTVKVYIVGSEIDMHDPLFLSILSAFHLSLKDVVKVRSECLLQMTWSLSAKAVWFIGENPPKGYTKATLQSPTLSMLRHDPLAKKRLYLDGLRLLS